MGTFLFIAVILLAAFFIYMNFDDIKKYYEAAKGKIMTLFQWLKITFFKTI